MSEDYKAVQSKDCPTVEKRGWLLYEYLTPRILIYLGHMIEGFLYAARKDVSAGEYNLWKATVISYNGAIELVLSSNSC